MFEELTLRVTYINVKISEPIDATTLDWDCLAGRRPNWGHNGLSSFLKALLNFKIKNHSWGWKVETKESEKLTAVGEIRRCWRRATEKEQEQKQEGSSQSLVVTCMLW